MLAVALALPAAGAPAFVPYTTDEHTLHLWHLDEAGPPFKDDGISPTPLLGLKYGAVAGKAPFPGFGAAVSFELPPGTERGYGPILLAKPEPDQGWKDNVDPPFPITGGDGAFTFEALVKLDCLPRDAPSLALDIVSMDDEDGANRTFIFRIEKPGFLCFLPIAGSAVRGGGLATIPETGPHAIVPGEWFHAAVAYDGRETAVNNLKLYWTRLSAGDEVANLIGQGTLTADLARRLGDFAIGNSGPALGLLDAAQDRYASWTSEQPLLELPAAEGETYLLSWSEAYNVIPGASLRATYLNVPAGRYTFRAIAIGLSATRTLLSSILSLGISCGSRRERSTARYFASSLTKQKS